VLNTKCFRDFACDGYEDGDEQIVVIPQNGTAERGYSVTVLQSVQSLFAHLIGSKMQYYIPRFFWETFMLGGVHLNLREQQDALEFFNALADVIDDGMKKVNAEPVFERLFGGTFADQKICKDCPHR
jgi:ubiquitin carboxyl-terminal hydrolase 9/24